jgi:hypothetical protein
MLTDSEREIEIGRAHRSCPDRDQGNGKEGGSIYQPVLK